MKIRMDFVTNSSSTGYVVITVSTDKGIIHTDNSYDTGYGGWIWNYKDINSLSKYLRDIKTGEELYNLLSDRVESFEYFSKVSEFRNILTDIKERKDLKTITMKEETEFDDGDQYVFFLEYDFEYNAVMDFVNGYARDRISEEEFYNMIKDY